MGAPPFADGGEPDPIQMDGPDGHHRGCADGRDRLPDRDRRPAAGRRKLGGGRGAGDLDHPGLRPREHGRPPLDRADLDIVGRVKLYTSGFAVFTVGSLLTSLAVDPAQVIAFRAIQGLGSAILFTNSAAMIVDATPADELGLSLGINQVAFRMGSMAGLTLSGIILSVLDWRALF